MEKKLMYYLNTEELKNGKLEETIDQTQKDFPNKEVKANIEINEYGVHVITFEFENKNSYFNKISIWFRKKKEQHLKKKMLAEKNRSYNYYDDYLYSTNIIRNEKTQQKINRFSRSKYGQYQSQGNFKPF